MKYTFLSGVVLVVSATVTIPGAWAAETRALASDGADHVGAGFAVPVLDALGEIDFLLNGEQRCLGNFPEV